ncbi:MAG: spore coat protein [Firmicutes bacterium]|nr:spore coat protein [Bacillota bacterium]
MAGGYQNYPGAQAPTIKNPQPSAGQQPKTPALNDRDRLNDMLLTEKYLTDGLNVFAREASHQSLHRDVMQILNQTHHAARELFNLMFEKGWYTLQAEQPSHIAQQQQKFTGYESQFAAPPHFRL